MAERRMFSKTIVDSDAFLEMPLSTQALYFHLGMRADDDGFVSSPKNIMRMTGSSEDEMKILLSKKFILGFDSGVVVIKHWKINNYLRSDRTTATVYTKELAQLEVRDNRSYTLSEPCNQPSTTCQPTAYIEEVSIEEVSIDKDSIEDEEITPPLPPKKIIPPKLTELEKTIEDFKKHRKQMKSPMTDRAIELLIIKIDKMATDDNKKIEILNQSIENGWKGIFEIKSTNINNGAKKDKFNNYEQRTGVDYEALANKAMQERVQGNG